jgi:hypothetical protein
MTQRSPVPGIETATGSRAAVPADAGLERAAPSRWRAAEARLYPLIVSDPDLYEAAVRLISEARDVLRETCRTAAELAEVECGGVLARCPSAAATTARGIDPDAAVDAARAHRWRELTGHQPAVGRRGSTVGSDR